MLTDRLKIQDSKSTFEKQMLVAVLYTKSKFCVKNTYFSNGAVRTRIKFKDADAVSILILKNKKEFNIEVSDRQISYISSSDQDEEWVLGDYEILRISGDRGFLELKRLLCLLIA